MRTRLAIAFLFATSITFAQQISLNSQYLFNEMLVNPGATGIKDHIPVQLSFRKQWTNFPGSPTTQALSCNSSVYKNLGLGGTFFNDVAGPSRRTGITVNGAYQLTLDLKQEHILGMGLGIDLTQHVIDETKLITYLPDDPAVLRGYNNKLVPDANVGIYYRYRDMGFVGLSAYNLVQSNRDLFDFQNGLINPLVRTYYLYGGYNFTVRHSNTFKLTGLLQAIETGTMQFDVTAMYVYHDYLWFGLSYRHLDAAVAMIGGQVGPVRMGYSYDYTLSDIGRYSSGSHEVFIELQLDTEKTMKSKTPWLKRTTKYKAKI